MEADSFKIAKVFSNGGDIHFRLPYFQREYAWNKDNWETLWNDILDLYVVFHPERQSEHFMGSLVVINEGTVHGTIPSFKLVDGQQRLTTISLMLCALADLIKDSQPPLYNRIRKYITNPDEEGELYYKLLPTSKHGDRDAYLDILQGNIVEQKNGSQILPAYTYYESRISNKLQSGEMTADQLFLVIINSLQVVFINLNNNERPYQIFESLNAKGKPLTQADLVRNYIAMKLPENRQQEIFEKHWLKIENMLQENRQVGRSRLGELTAFLRHYLAFRNGVLGNEEHVYARFRDRIEEDFNTPVLFEDEIKTLQRFAGYYDKFLRPVHEPDMDIRKELDRLNILEISTAFPFIFAMYEARDLGQINRDQLIEGLKLIENYIVRRYITNEPTNYLNKVFPALWRDIDLSDFIPSLTRTILHRNYPGNYKVKQSVYTRHLYDKSGSIRARTTLILESINLHLSRKQKSGAVTVLDGPPTIEHIMPQTLDEKWRGELGNSFEQVYDQYLDTLGNLTLVTPDWNSSLSNSEFSIKKSALARHGLLVNTLYFNKDLPRWDGEAIRSRAEFLVELILEIWSAIGELPQPKSSTGTKPTKLTILGQTFSVISWRDVAIRTTESIIQLVDNFDQIAHGLPSFLGTVPFRKASRQLSNGYHINVNLSAESIKTYCKKLIAAAGLNENDWHVEDG